MRATSLDVSGPD